MSLALRVASRSETQHPRCLPSQIDLWRAADGPVRGKPYPGPLARAKRRKPLSTKVYANSTLQLDTIYVYLGWFCYFLDISQKGSRI
jgi:hypothetical protein